MKLVSVVIDFVIKATSLTTHLYKLLMMNRTLKICIILFYTINLQSQSMTPEKLMALIQQEADTVSAQANSAQFLFNDAMLICIYDEKANRMRIISPIVEREKIGEEELLNALVANFHSALDVKYALSDEVIWSVFAHPLKELTEDQVVDAIFQVYAAAATFGTTYSSTNLIFPGNTNKKEVPKKPRILKKI